MLIRVFVRDGSSKLMFYLSTHVSKDFRLLKLGCLRFTPSLRPPDGGINSPSFLNTVTPALTLVHHNQIGV